MNLNFTMVAQALAFFAFIWFTVKFIWPPLLRAIETRQKQIADGLAAAERGKQDLELAAKRSAEELQRARTQAGERRSAAEMASSEASAQRVSAGHSPRPCPSSRLDG